MTPTMNNKAYGIELHAHRFAAWSACRAAFRGRTGLNICSGSLILENCGAANFLSANSLPDPTEIDASHRVWCENACGTAEHLGLNISHGIAAKLVNVYLKARFVCGGQHFHPKVSALHPPVDGILLSSLVARGIIQRSRTGNIPSWTKFDLDNYQNVIMRIRDHLGNSPMWMIEEHWDPRLEVRA